MRLLTPTHAHRVNTAYKAGRFCGSNGHERTLRNFVA